jgi:hypothetical protein
VEAEVWFTQSFLRPCMASKACSRAAWALTWMNKKEHWWVPLRGQAGYDDFVRFARSGSPLFAPIEYLTPDALRQ